MASCWGLCSHCLHTLDTVISPQLIHFDDAKYWNIAVFFRCWRFCKSFCTGNSNCFLRGSSVYLIKEMTLFRNTISTLLKLKRFISTKKKKYPPVKDVDIHQAETTFQSRNYGSCDVIFGINQTTRTVEKLFRCSNQSDERNVRWTSNKNVSDTFFHSWFGSPVLHQSLPKIILSAYPYIFKNQNSEEIWKRYLANWSAGTQAAGL